MTTPGITDAGVSTDWYEKVCVQIINEVGNVWNEIVLLTHSGPAMRLQIQLYVNKLTENRDEEIRRRKKL